MINTRNIRQETQIALQRVEVAVERIANGGMVLVVDDFERENEADLLMAAEHITPEVVNFMAREGRGLICQTITAEQARRLLLPPQTAENTALHDTAFTVSVDAKHNVSSGISAADRAQTIRSTADPASRPADLARPGHIFPIVAQSGGVFARRGHTEAGCDLARLAGCLPSSVICEVMNEDGTMARGEQVTMLSEKHDLPLVSVEDLVLYRSLTGDTEVKRVATAKLPTRFEDFTATVWTSSDPGCREIITVSSLTPRSKGDNPPPLVRLHSECLTGESLGSLRCDCGAQLDAALEAIGREPGLVVYLRQEGRGIGLVNKFRAYVLQDSGLDTVDANLELGHKPDERSYAAATAVLRELELTKVRLLTNNPDKYEAVLCSGIQAERIELFAGHCPENENYLATKMQRMSHFRAPCEAVTAKS